MSIGIELKIPNEYGNYLKQILNNIDREDYYITKENFKRKEFSAYSD